MKNKIIAFLCASVLVTGMLAGCGGKAPASAGKEAAAADAVKEDLEKQDTAEASAESSTAAKETAEAAEAAAAETAAAGGASGETAGAAEGAAAGDAASNQEASAGGVGMANPWVEITEEEAVTLVDRLFTSPYGAEVQAWLKCESLGDPAKYISPMVQLSFSMQDMNFTARAQQGISEDEDISGIYTEWTEGPEDVTLANWGGGHMQGKIYRSVNDTGYIDLITWYDVEIGISYSLSVAAEDLDGFDIQAVAEQMYSEKNEPFGNIPDAPEEIETGDGVYGATLQSSMKDRIGTQNEYGIFYDIVYQSLFDGDKLYIVGSMNYKNHPAQDPIFISDDLTHVFTVNADTAYELRGGSEGPEIVTADEFAARLEELIDTGLYLEIEIKDGIVTTASISA